MLTSTKHNLQSSELLFADVIEDYPGIEWLFRSAPHLFNKCVKLQSEFTRLGIDNKRELRLKTKKEKHTRQISHVVWLI